MSQKNMNEGSPGGKPPTPSRRKRLRIVIIVAMVLAVLGLTISFAPRYVARHLLSSHLDELGIEYEGVDTLRINPWTGEVWIGPVWLKMAEADQGQLAEFGAKFAFIPLFEKHVEIERVLVRGIDLDVARSKDNTFTLNGVPLDQFLPADEAPTSGDDEWGAGIDSLELRESRMIFTEEGGGELVVEIDSLLLNGFRTWQPDQPGTFTLKGQVNEILLNWTGEARPFATNITVAVDSLTDNADMAKVVRYTGPLGFERQEGIYNSRFKHDITLYDSGRVVGQSRGTIELSDADYARGDDFALASNSVGFDLETDYELSEEGDMQIGGRVVVEAGTTAGAVSNETSLALESGRIELVELDAAFGADQSIRVSAKPKIDIEAGQFSGPVEISIDKLLQMLTYLQSLSAGKVVSSDETGLADFSEDSVTLPKSDISVQRLTSQFGTFSLQTAQGKVSVDLAGDSKLAEIKIGASERDITIESFSSALDGLQLQSGQGELSLRVAGTNALTGLKGGGQIGELTVPSMQAVITEFGMASRTGYVELELVASTDASGISGLVYETEDLPKVAFNLGTVKAALANGSIDVTPKAVGWQAKADASMGALVFEIADGEKAAAKIDEIQVTALEADQSPSIAADTVKIGNPDLSLTRSFLLSFGESAGTEAEGAVTGAALIEQIQTLLMQLGYTPGAVDGLMGQRTAVAIRAFQKQQGLKVDGKATAALLADLKAVAAGESGQGEGEPAALRLNRFAIVDGGSVRFLDDVVKPKVKINTEFETVEVRNIDTTDPDQQTTVIIVAKVNEFTQVELDGWVSALGKQPNLDMTAKVANLELPTYSPYAVLLGGVQLQSGQLSTMTTAAASQGSLDGLIDLDMLDVQFEPLSEEDAQQLTEQTGGLPVTTAVALLQDSEGRIKLKLPLGGTLSEPSIDLSSAIGKAIGGALKSVFPNFKHKQGNDLVFESMAFAPGSAELTEAARTYADELINMLQSRPKLSLNVCGRAVAQDAEILAVSVAAATPPAAPDKANQAEAQPEEQTAPVTEDAAAQQLLELAVERTRAVRRYIINERGIDAARVAECRPKADATDQGQPRAEVSL